MSVKRSCEIKVRVKVRKNRYIIFDQKMIISLLRVLKKSAFRFNSKKFI